MNDLVNRAFAFARSAHFGQVRKNGKPYINHPLSVANILAENGASDELIAAGFLHDTIEDADITAEELKKNFGDGVVRFILFDTEDKSLPWEQRKTATLNALEHCDREYAMLICADKLSNIKDISDDLKTIGESVWNNFKYGREKQEWLYRKYLSALLSVSDLKMYSDLERTVNSVFKKGEQTLCRQKSK